MRKILISIAVLILTSCAVDNQEMSRMDAASAYKDGPPPQFSQFKDIPIPEDSKMDLERTLLFGSENDWIGRLYFIAPYNAGGIFDFYVAEMPLFGWQQLTAVRAELSTLTFKRGNRIASIEITPSSFNGSVISFTVSPTNIKTYIRKQSRKK